MRTANRPNTGFAAAKTDVRLFSMVVIPGRCRQPGSEAESESERTSFCYRYRLLLHCLVDGHPILIPHLVELVDAHHTAICQDHSAAFKVKLPLEKP